MTITCPAGLNLERVMLTSADAIATLKERSMETNAITPDDGECPNCGEEMLHNGPAWRAVGFPMCCSRGCSEALMPGTAS